MNIVIEKKELSEPYSSFNIKLNRCYLVGSAPRCVEDVKIGLEHLEVLQCLIGFKFFGWLSSDWSLLVITS